MIEGAFKTALFRGMEATGILAVAEAGARGVPILAYHGVTAHAASPVRNLRRLHIPRERFEQHLQILRERWHPTSLSTLCDSLETGQPLPPRSVVVTFDDGYRNLLSVALPVLRAYEVPATVFVITAGGRQRLWMDRLETCLLATTTPAVTWDGQRFPLASSADRLSSVRELMMRFDHLGRDRENALRRLLALVGDPTEQPDDDRDLLTWEEIRALREAGLEIGSHADCHEPLTERPSDEAESALTKSRETLEWQLGPGPYALSYPYGAWNKELARAVQVAGFSCAVTGDPGLNRTGANLFALRRLLVGADDDMLHLRASLSGVRSFWKFRAVYRNG